MTWAAIWLFLQKAWVWTKHNWKIAALAVWTVVIFFVSRKSASAALRIIKIQQENYQKEIDILNESHNAEISKRNEILNQYQDVISSIEEEYAKENKQLQDSKKNEIKKILEDYYNEPETINSYLEENFGFKHVE